MFLKKLIDFSSSNFSCDSAFLLYHCKVFASSLAGTCSEPPSSRTSSGKIFVRVASGVFVCNCPKQLSQWLLERNHRFQDAPPKSFRVSKYYDLTSITVKISPGVTDCATPAPSLAGLWCSLRSTTYSRFQRFQN